MDGDVRLHLVDATYELFRAHFAPRPAIRDRSGRPVTATVGLIRTLLSLLRDEGATHVGCATDHVIRSFRNELLESYKSEVGVAQELLDQFGLAERAIEALGVACWPMVEWEADDALATAAARWQDDPGVAQILICTPDKDLAQCVRDGRVVLRDRRKALTIDEEGVRAKYGVPPSAIVDLLALSGDASDGYPGLPGWGRVSAATMLAAFGSVEGFPDDPAAWPFAASRARTLAETLRARRDELELYRTLARLRTDAPLPQSSIEELRWRGADREAFGALAEELGVKGLENAPHRWRE